MVDLAEDRLLELDVFDLLQFDDLRFLEGFQCDYFAAECCQIDLAEGTSADHTQELVVGDLTVRVLDLAALAWRSHC